MGLQQDEQDKSSDLLVMQLDEAISRALEDATKNINSPIIDEDTEANSKLIQEDEAKAKRKWLLDHSVLDADGRARCSFHFCRKLFKDQTFLHKHLLKKHTDHLLAEQAKCHDPYMMKTWEAASIRPFPQVLVFCGNRFGLINATVTGPEPMADDPEPSLLKQEELQQAKKFEQEQIQNKQFEKIDFVDVDEMKDDKVVLEFDNEEVIPKKKKKKKKKLL